MTDIQFSLVIPTRERADTLRVALKTCLMQDFESYEIVVCDNCSSSSTRAVVEEISSPKVVYFRASQPLCMRDNWNLAYSLTRGRYITFIGDDDSLMPFAFSFLHSLFERERVEAVRWDSAIYSWPNIARTDMANHLQVPILRTASLVGGQSAIEDVITRSAPGTLLPNIYHGCVARNVLEKIQEKTGCVFDSFNCDTYSSFAIAHVAREFISLSVPLSISGFSASSNNIAFNFLRSKHENTRKLRHENESAGLRLHPFVPDLPSGFVCLADSFLRAKEDLFPESPISLDRRAMIESLINVPPIDASEEWPYVKAELRRSISDDPELLSWFDKRVHGYFPEPTPRDNYRPDFEGSTCGRLFLDAAKYSVKDIEGATLLTSRLLGYRAKSLNWLTGKSTPFRGIRDSFWRLRLELLLKYLKK
jgi:glycosyltransferase involved in cell wall biosynthesis